MINANTHEEITNNIRQTTWNLFREHYRQKYKQFQDSNIFTVLASLSLVDADSRSVQVVSVGFGTKSLPQSLLLANKKEYLLPDMHAEMLAVQGFRRFLLEQVSIKDTPYLSWVQKKQKYQLATNYTLYLYCSQIFCGDCCVSKAQESYSGAKPLKYFRSQAYPQLKYQPNILRTKPGRLDLPISKRSPLLSCSDMLGFFNLVGIQGLQLFSLMTPVYINHVIVQGSQALSSNITKGIDLVARLAQLTGRSKALLQRQIFNIKIGSKQRRISSQLVRNQPSVTVIEKKEAKGRARDQEGFELCGIITGKDCQWINGKTGLPEGSSLKTYFHKGKVSNFSEFSLKKDFSGYRQGPESFKYESVGERLKKLFGEWMDDILQ